MFGKFLSLIYLLVYGIFEISSTESSKISYMSLQWRRKSFQPLLPTINYLPPSDSRLVLPKMEYIGLSIPFYVATTSSP